jgi:hypothetical protein
MRLNRWQRVGIAASILWALGAAIYTHNADVQRANDFVQWAYKVCADGKAIRHDPDLSSCDKERDRNLKTWMEGDEGNAAITALAPLPFAWLAGFVLLYVGRAQIVGFRAVVPWARLGWQKRTFVVFSVLASAATVLFGLVVILNLYVDALVPVGLPPGGPAVIKTGENLVTVEGTWTRTGPTADSSLAYPLQTSRIECNKEERRCTEARASVAGSVLTADLTDYDVESWTDAAIILRNAYPCATEVFTIDLNTDAVTGAGHPTNQDSDYCRVYGGKEKSWTYQLTDGFKVYWEQRQKARPLALRLFQTLFGN